MRNRERNEPEWWDMPVGPSPKQQLRDIQEELERQGEILKQRGIYWETQMKSLRAKYGDELCNLTSAYMRSVGTPEEEKALVPFAQALAKAIEAQPTDKKGEWLMGFLKDTKVLI